MEQYIGSPAPGVKRSSPKLRHRIQPRSVSATLRHWAAMGQIRLVRDGRSYYESLYTKR